MILSTNWVCFILARIMKSVERLGYKCKSCLGDWIQWIKPIMLDQIHDYWHNSKRQFSNQHKDVFFTPPPPSFLDFQCQIFGVFSPPFFTFEPSLCWGSTVPTMARQCRCLPGVYNGQRYLKDSNTKSITRLNDLWYFLLCGLLSRNQIFISRRPFVLPPCSFLHAVS